MWEVIALIVTVFYFLIKWARSTGKNQPVEGAVFVTGCDSGMGETTAFHLAKTGYHVFAGCFAKESFKKYESLKNVTCIQLDVSDEESVNASAVVVKETIAESKGKISGLYGVLQCAGIAYTAPFEYM
jgi:NADP-dependent 3-hydroxy acid dehydrogenase YdfG